MTLDQAIREAVGLEVRAALQELRDVLPTPAATEPSVPLDHTALVERGYSTDEAYALLRAHGVKLPGGRKRRISLAVLTRIEAGELAPSIPNPAKKQGRHRSSGSPQGS